MLSLQLFFVLKRTEVFIILLLRLYRHSWLGPGIWCSWTVGNVIFVAGICAIIEIRSLVLARDDAVGALVVFSGCLLVFRQKNIRTKVYHWFLNVLANEFATHSLINAFALAVLSSKLSFCRYEHKSFVSFKNVVLCTYKLVCMMNVWQKWHELVHVSAVGCSSLCILMFFCSYVFLFIALYYRWLCALVEIRSLVLARDDGVGALCCCFVDVHILKTEEHKNKRGHWKSNVHSSGLDVPLLFQCICIIDAECSTLFVEKEQNKRVYSLLFRSLRLRWMCA